MTTTARPDIDVLTVRLAECPLLAAASTADVRSLAAEARVRHFRRGSYLFHQGDDAPDVVVLYDGRVEISSTSPDGARQFHTVLSPPQLFGELGVLASRPRNSSALAITDAVVLSVPAETFVEFLQRSPAAALGVIRALADQVHAFGGLIDDLLFLDLRARVAKRLLGLVTPTFADLPPDGTKVPAGVTQADLANLAGGSRENVSRILSEFVRRGLLQRSGRGRYVLADVKALARAAHL